MATFTGSVSKYPARAAFFSYLGMILFGGMLLAQPFSAATQKDISLIDGMFTATSALCVTGLTVRDTGKDFSFAGQFIIMLLIQIGGIGIMTVTTFITLTVGGRATLRQRQLLAETLGSRNEKDLRWVLGKVLIATAVFEIVGFVVLAARDLFDADRLSQFGVPQLLWYAWFHSVAAFCNAGFGTYSDNLMGYSGDWPVNLTIMALIVIGGIGFPVIFDVRRNWRRPERMQLHSKVMLIGTTGLIVLGTAIFLALEWQNVLAGMPWHQRFLVSLFQSITPRTAGFNTIDYAALTDSTLFITVLLMIVGAGPCSTGGGFKVSTLMLMLIYSGTRLVGAGKVNLFRRTIATENIGRAIATALLYSVIAVVGLVALLLVGVPADPARGFLGVLFETVSALGTVGLTTGITTKLTIAGKLIVILLMFIGRLGPISVFVVLSRHEREQKIEFPQEEVLVG